MKYLIYTLLLSIITTSCSWINKKQPNETEIYENEISKINWEQVDEPSGLVLCDSLLIEEEKVACLQKTLQQNIQENLVSTIIETIDLNVDTIWVAVNINPDSSITLIPDVSLIANTDNQQNILKAITNTTQNLPKAYPAIKRGIPVKTQYNMPLTFIK